MGSASEDEEGTADDEGGLSVELKRLDWRLKAVLEEQPLILRPSFSAICTEVGVETGVGRAAGLSACLTLVARDVLCLLNN